MNMILWLACVLPGANLETGWHHQYQGQLVDRADTISKRFTLDCIVSDDGIYWSVDEKGSGQWPWSSHFGKWASSADLAPSLLFRANDVTSVVELPTIDFHSPKPLTANATWEDDGYTFTVQADGARWRVQSRNGYGLTTAAFVSKGPPLLEEFRRDIVVGRGDRYELTLERTKSQELPAEEVVTTVAQYESMLKLRRDLGRSDRVRENRWNKEQLATLRERLPEQPAASLHAVLMDAQTEVQQQGEAANALKKMEQDALGKLVELNLSETKLGGGKLGADQLDNKVVVLHFWTYQSKPLEQPYGQVGYVDFLSRKLAADDALVLGLSAPNKEQTESERAREARKVVQFMNLSYPVAFDDGTLGKIGDPTKAGGKLPLFVVLNRQGRVIHYHAGNYEVDRREGLKQHKEVVAAAVAKKE